MVFAPDATQSWLGPTRHRLRLHGADVELTCTVRQLRREVRDLFSAFHGDHLADPRPPTIGTIEPYESSIVLRRLPASASLVAQTPELAEIYQDGDRYWLIDERWGMSEINLLRGTWRSWVLPGNRLDTFRCAEMAILWPMSQLLRSRGVCLLPAASVALDGQGILLISPFSLEPELSAMLQAGYRVIGQRWTALRAERGRVMMLHVPGKTERRIPRRNELDLSERWFDLCGGDTRRVQPSAACNVVLAVEHGRRATTRLHELTSPDAARLLRRAWPIAELHPHRRQSGIASRLAETANCFTAELSRRSSDLLSLLSPASSSLSVAVA